MWEGWSESLSQEYAFVKQDTSHNLVYTWGKWFQGSDLKAVSGSSMVKPLDYWLDDGKFKSHH